MVIGVIILIELVRKDIVKLVKYMNKDLGNNIVISLAFTTASSLYFENYNIYDNLILYFGCLIILSLWSWLINKFIPIKITKDQDEILHPVTQLENTLHICNIEKHYGKKFNSKLIEKCDCGSTMFRIYNEDTEKGTYIQFICVKCNQKATGLEFNWRKL